MTTMTEEQYQAGQKKKAKTDHMAVFQKQHRRFEGSDLVELLRQAMPLHVDCEVIAPTIMYFDDPREGLVVKNKYGRWAIKVEEIERFEHV